MNGSQECVGNGFYTGVYYQFFDPCHSQEFQLLGRYSDRRNSVE